ncbi:MAG: UDP-3-O-acyl-N-acetylglucosamine deacetylase, partial [Flavobacteriia bacterium]|nr:UDP-3-O-acyl-N-acetylglucosamine deacetylase [Flavobacteriia bacterium]
MLEKQTTLKKSVKLTGIGLHTGEKVELEILPAAENHGYRFQRVDLEGQPVIKADCDNVVSTDRGTTLEKNRAKVYKTEH